MSKYSSIAVFYGSDSSEWEVACRSGEYTASRIDEHVYDVYEILARFGRWQLKCTWPTRKELFESTRAVISGLVIMTVVVAVLDGVFAFAVKLIAGMN